MLLIPNKSRNSRRMKEPTHIPDPGFYTTRLGVVLRHTTRYAFEPQARLAHDVHVSRSTISRIVNGRCQPSFLLAARIAEALAADLGCPIQARDVFSPDGTFAEPSGCRLCGCKGCLPEEAFDRHGNRTAAFRGQKPGEWSLSDASFLHSPSVAPSA